MLAYVYELMLKECLLHPGGLHKLHRALPTKAPFSRLQWCVKWTSLTEQEWHTVQKGQGMKGILKILSSYTVMSQIRAYLRNCFWLTKSVCVHVFCWSHKFCFRCLVKGHQMIEISKTLCSCMSHNHMVLAR